MATKMHEECSTYNISHLTIKSAKFFEIHSKKKERKQYTKSQPKGTRLKKTHTLLSLNYFFAFSWNSDLHLVIITLKIQSVSMVIPGHFNSSYIKSSHATNDMFTKGVTCPIQELCTSYFVSRGRVYGKSCPSSSRSWTIISVNRY